MKTALNSPASVATSNSPAAEDPRTAHRAVTTTSPAFVPAPDLSNGVPPRPAGVGRPSGLNGQMIDALCAVIRETGASDSAAAARVGVHPSTVSRWKRDCPDFAILLRAAREDFRIAQLSIIFAEANAGRATGWRAAAWVLERIFPEDYAPRARERERFREQHEAACAREAEGSELALPDGEGAEETIRPSDNETIEEVACDRGEALQNVHKAGTGAPRAAGQRRALPVGVLQNVQNSTRGASMVERGREER